MSENIGQQYDKIAAWWNAYHQDSNYGVSQIETALKFILPGGKALDVGCGAGGRLIQCLEKKNLAITGIDASARMIELARANHPHGTFVQADIADWSTEARFNFIVAWDCLFHLPLAQQKPVLKKLCGLLSEGGVMIHSFGDAIGEHTDFWHAQEFGYSSMGITENIKVLIENGLTLRHLEIDQFPEKHVYAVSQK